ncbi:MAG: translation initiation factor IF-1 [Vicinamibacteria bacterium]
MLEFQPVMKPIGERIEVTARVMEALPSSLYRVETLQGTVRQATAHCAASDALRVRPGDVVVVEFSPFDLSRGRIVRCVQS